MTDTLGNEVVELKSEFQKALLKNIKTARFIAWLLIGMGVIAVIFPVLATMAVDLLVAWLILFYGVGQIVYSLGHKNTLHFWVSIFFGIFSVVVGVIMAALPVAGVVSLTSLMAAWFIVSGTYKFIAAFQIRPSSQWTWMLLNGLITVVLGYYIIIKFDSSVAWILGLFFGIDALFGGFTLKSLVEEVEKGQSK